MDVYLVADRGYSMGDTGPGCGAFRIGGRDS